MKDIETNAAVPAVRILSDGMTKETRGNRLFVRDEETNALVPVVQAYGEDIAKKDVTGNRLYAIDEETNARMPVLDIRGMSAVPDAADAATVTFIDHEGVISEVKTEPGGSVTSYPVPKEYDLLTFTGWTHSPEELAGIRGDVTVGAMYRTTDGCTYFFGRITAATGLTLPLYLTGTGEIEIDWGDETVESRTVFGVITHTYAQPADYTVKIRAVSGTYTLGGANAVGTGDSLYRCHIGAGCGLTDAAFQRNTALKSVVIPEGISSVGSHTFDACCALRHAVLPRGVTALAGVSFGYCYSLERIALPNGITVMGSGAFYMCHALKSVSLPKGLATVPVDCFVDCHALRGVSIPATVTAIETNAFRICQSLQLELPDGLTEIGSNPFVACRSLREITVPAGVTVLGSYVFESCTALRRAELPAGMLSVGEYAFLRCTALEEVILHADVPPELLSANAFQEAGRACNFYVPDESVEAYRSATSWTAFAERIYPASELTT